MRGTVAKRLRAEARKIAGPSQLMVVRNSLRTYGTLFYEGYRRTYQDAKKRYLQG